MRQDNRKQISFIPEGGQVPPQAPDAEEAVLGAAMLEEDAAMQVMSILKPEMFYIPAHQHIYSAIYDMTNMGKVVDLITLLGELRKRGELEEIGGAVYLTELTSKVVSSANIETHARIVKEKYTAREYLRLSMQIQAMVYNDDDIGEITEAAENELLKLSSDSQKSEPERIDTCVDRILVNVQKVINNPGVLVGVPSGFSNIDRITGGFQNSDLIVLAGRTSMGKTSMALALARGAAMFGSPVGIFSLEMSKEQLVTRYLSGASGFSNMEIRNGKMDMKNLITASEVVANLPIYIDDSSNISVAELRSKTKKLIIQKGIKLVVVDYLQLMKSTGTNTEQEVSRIAEGLKSVAKDLNIPIIALSQLSRAVEGRGDKRPQLSDLRSSGSIEQASDIVTMIYRPAYYGMSDIEINGNTYNTKNLIIFDIQKHRNGALFPVVLYHNDALTVISDNIEDVNRMPF